jgi:hypothetical protein
MTSRKQEDSGSWRRKLRITLFGELSLEEAMDLSQDRLLLDLKFLQYAESKLSKFSRTASKVTGLPEFDSR